MAGFSFAALVGLTIADAKIKVTGALPVSYLMVSFLCYLSMVNLEQYKFTRMHERLSAALYDTATFCLILSICVLIQALPVSEMHRNAITVLALLVFMANLVTQVGLMWNYLAEVEKLRHPEKEKLK